jgi:palmitoyltransferase
MSTRPVRENGFSLPLHPLQILAWVLMTTLTVTYYILTVPALPTPYQAVFSVVYSTALTLTAALGYICTKCNPTDPTVYLERQSRISQQPFDSTGFPKVCKICRTHVLQHSRHCGKCNRCVNGFDHHCKWLNNCIGQRNYRTFVVLIGTLELLALWQTAVVLYCLVQVASDGSQEQQRLVKAFGIGRSGIDAYRAISAVNITIGSLVALAVLHLIVLHLFLRAQGLTTYEYILGFCQLTCAS